MFRKRSNTLSMSSESTKMRLKRSRSVFLPLVSIDSHNDFCFEFLTVNSGNSSCSRSDSSVKTLHIKCSDITHPGHLLSPNLIVKLKFVCVISMHSFTRPATKRHHRTLTSFVITRETGTLIISPTGAVAKYCDE